jgi:hypothetical protein
VILDAGEITGITSLGLTGTRVTSGFFTDLAVTNAISGSVTGNAATVTTNANLTGDVTSVGNATTIGNGKVTEAMHVFADNTTNDASTTKHGFLLKATAPAANVLNIVGIANGETVYANKALFDSTNPAAVGTAAPGTSLTAAHRDHVHAYTPPFVFFSAYHAGAQNTGNNAFGQISFTTELYDTGADYDTGTSTFTAPLTGYYMFNAHISTSATSTRFICSLFVDGVEAFRGQDVANANSAANTSSQVSSLIYLTAGQAVTVYGFGNTAKALTTTAHTVYFNGFYIGS